MYLFSLFLCFIFTFASASTPDSLLTEEEIAQHKTTAAGIINSLSTDFEQQNLLLNLFYHMYYFAQIDAVYNKNVTICAQLLDQERDILDPTESSISKILPQLAAQITTLQKHRLKHFETWIHIDTSIQEHHPELITLIENIADKAAELLEAYTKRSIPEIDHLLKEQEEPIETAIKKNHIVGKVINMLLKEPELICQDETCAGTQKINTLYGLNKTNNEIIQEAKKLKYACSLYGFNLQKVQAHFIKQCYDALHDKITQEHPDRNVQLLVAINNELKCVEQAIENNESN